jgi:hypothetical protein
VLYVQYMKMYPIGERLCAHVHYQGAYKLLTHLLSRYTICADKPATAASAATSVVN